MQLSVHVENQSPIVRKLTIKVPAREVSTRLERGWQSVQRTAKLKGFRPGHAPLSVIKQFYGEDVRHQVFHDLIDESYQRALSEQQIRAVGRPTIETPNHKTGEGEHAHTIHDGQDLTFTAVVEVLPEIQVKGYTGLPVTQENKEVSDEQLAEMLKTMQDSAAELVSVSSALTDADGKSSSRPVKQGDFCDITFSGGVVTEKGVEERAGMKGTRMIEVGSGSLIAGFEDHLVGMRQGETKTFRVPFPADFYEKELASKESEFTVTINEVKEKKLPALDDALAKQLGYEDLGDMKKKAREHMERERAEEIDRNMRNQLVEALIEKNPMDVPQSLIQGQTRALAQDVSENLRQQGFSQEMINETLAQELETLKKRAESQVRASLILETIAKEEKIEVTPEEVSAEMGKLAIQMRVDDQKLREYYDREPGRKEDLAFRMRQERTLKLLLEKAKVKKAKA